MERAAWLCIAGAPAPLRRALAFSAAVSCAACRSPAPPSIDAPSAVPKYASHASPLSRDNAYFRAARASDFWSLVPYYVPQDSDVSCSLASASMLVNAARRNIPLGTDEPLVTQRRLFERVNSPVWRKGLAPGGEGVTLDELAVLIRRSLEAFELEVRELRVVHVQDASRTSLERWREVLEHNEAHADDWLLINFFDAELTGAGDYGHIAPVGAYDSDGRRLLVLDPDREWYEPFWVPDVVALRGMATLDTVSKRNRGYVYVAARPRSAQPAARQGSHRPAPP